MLNINLFYIDKTFLSEIHEELFALALLHK